MNTISLEELKGMIDSSFDNKETLKKFSENEKGDILFNGVPLSDNSSSGGSISIVKWKPEIKIKDRSIVNHKGYLYISTCEYISNLNIEQDIELGNIYSIGFGDKSKKNIHMSEYEKVKSIDIPENGFMKYRIKGKTFRNFIDIDTFNMRVVNDNLSRPNVINRGSDGIKIYGGTESNNIGEGQYLILDSNADYTIKYKSSPMNNIMLTLYDATEEINVDNFVSKIILTSSENVLKFNTGDITNFFITLTQNVDSTTIEPDICTAVYDLMLLAGDYTNIDIPYIRHLSLSRPVLKINNGNLFNPKNMLIGNIATNFAPFNKKTHRSSNMIYVDPEKTYVVNGDNDVDLINLNNVGVYDTSKPTISRVKEFTGYRYISIINSDRITTDYFDSISITEKLTSTISKDSNSYTIDIGENLGTDEYIENGMLYKKWHRFKLKELFDLCTTEYQMMIVDDRCHLNMSLDNVLELNTTDRIEVYFKNYVYTNISTGHNKNIAYTRTSMPPFDKTFRFRLFMNIPKKMIDDMNCINDEANIEQWVRENENNFVYIKTINTHRVYNYDVLDTVTVNSGANTIIKATPSINEELKINIEPDSRDTPVGYFNSKITNGPYLYNRAENISSLKQMKNKYKDELIHICTKNIDYLSGINGKSSLSMRYIKMSTDYRYFVKYTPVDNHNIFDLELSYVNDYKQAYNDLKEYSVYLKDKINDIYDNINILNRQKDINDTKNIIPDDIYSIKDETLDGYIYNVYFGDVNTEVYVEKINPLNMEVICTSDVMVCGSIYFNSNYRGMIVGEKNICIVSRSNAFIMEKNTLKIIKSITDSNISISTEPSIKILGVSYIIDNVSKTYFLDIDNINTKYIVPEDKTAVMRNNANIRYRNGNIVLVEERNVISLINMDNMDILGRINMSPTYYIPADINYDTPIFMGVNTRTNQHYLKKIIKFDLGNLTLSEIDFKKNTSIYFEYSDTILDSKNKCYILPHYSSSNDTPKNYSYVDLKNINEEFIPIQFGKNFVSECGDIKISSSKVFHSNMKVLTFNKNTLTGFIQVRTDSGKEIWLYEIDKNTYNEQQKKYGGYIVKKRLVIEEILGINKDNYLLGRNQDSIFIYDDKLNLKSVRGFEKKPAHTCYGG